MGKYGEFSVESPLDFLKKYTYICISHTLTNGLSNKNIVKGAIYV